MLWSETLQFQVANEAHWVSSCTHHRGHRDRKTLRTLLQSPEEVVRQPKGYGVIQFDGKGANILVYFFVGERTGLLRPPGRKNSEEMLKGRG